MALSEFVAGYNGDCGETAELAALHALRAPSFPLDATSLKAIVARDVAHGWASANGSEPLAAIANDLSALGAKFTNYGYAEPYTVDWATILKEHGGSHPVILELANAGQLHGDEPGVQYHFICQLDYLQFADGDNVAARSGRTVNYSLSDLANARVCGCLVVLEAPGGNVEAVAVGYTQLANGWYKDSVSGLQIGAGIYDAAAQAGLTATPLLLGETHLPGSANTVACFGAANSLADGVVTWFNGTPYVAKGELAGHVIAGLFNTINGQGGQIADLKTQLAAAQAALQAAQQQPQPVPPTVPPAVVADLAKAQQDAATLAADVSQAQADSQLSTGAK